MIVVDANLLLYAHSPTFPEHDATRAWLEERLVATPRVGLAWSSVMAFVRLTTNERIFARPLSMGEAWEQAQAWLDAEPVWTPTPTPRHREHLHRCLGVPGLRSRDVPHAQLAALAMEHGLRLASADGGFARFPGLDWYNPLMSSG